MGVRGEGKGPSLSAQLMLAALSGKCTEEQFKISKMGKVHAPYNDISEDDNYILEIFSIRRSR